MSIEIICSIIVRMEDKKNLIDTRGLRVNKLQNEYSLRK